MVEFRLALRRDVPQLARLRWNWKIEENNHTDVTRDDFLRDCGAFLVEGIESGQWAHWIAVEDEALISVASVCRVVKIPHPRRSPRWLGYVTNVCTIPERRGQGIGSTLLAHLVDWARTEECDTLILWPDSRRIAFYERCGFLSNNEVVEYPFG
jgi:ribosomal protein S18 acetylase RimI-like enzyme